VLLSETLELDHVDGLINSTGSPWCERVLNQ